MAIPWVPTAFLVFPNVHSCFYNSIETFFFHFLTIAGLYHLAIKTGDERNSSTDANVWVQVYGDKGDTGHVQLKKSGMMENLFARLILLRYILLANFDSNTLISQLIVIYYLLTRRTSCIC